MVKHLRGRAISAPDFGSRGRGSNPTGGEILPEPKRRFIPQSLSCSPFHHLKMTEILLKGCKTLTHPSIHCEWNDNCFCSVCVLINSSNSELCLLVDGQIVSQKNR